MPTKPTRSIKTTKPSKKPQETVPVSIQRATEERLVDKKVLRPPPNRLPYVIGLAAVAGIAAGAAILFYIYHSETPWEPYERPEIILPEEQELIDDLDNMGNPTSTSNGDTEETPPPAVTFQQVLILDTPTGFLNVRAGAGTNTAKIGEVSPGEIYDLVSENTANGGWYQIKLADGTVGWVTDQYARIQ
ncbi:MAG: hypothetical protein UY73_C0012G0007 [Parcubacteria group bacterium GW2011_GWA2_52_8]|nr:MAG: hypothetical protein UY73_C0012G0007 [Parcubacteria group bacterium GW2011_GWA2_52_8]